MERHALLFLSAATLAIALLSFEAGRQSIGPKDALPAADFSSPESEPQSRGVSETVSADLSKATIENIGQVEFEQAYHLLHSAPREVLETWTKRLEALPPGARKTAAITAFFKTLAQLDTKTAVDLALTLTRREPRTVAVSAISATAPAPSLSEVGRLLTSVKLERVSASDLIATWSCTDPVSTSQFVAAHPAMADEHDLGVLLSSWAALDPMAARTWLDNLEPSRREASVYRGFYSGWFEHDQPAALNHLVANARDEKMDKTIASAASYLFGESPDAARAFILDLPEGQPRKTAISEITTDAAGRSLDGDAPVVAADTVAKWLFTLPVEDWRDNLGTVVSKWSEQDPAAVDHWLNDMPAPTRDRVAADFCLAYDWDDPQRNFAAGLKINDRQLREETFREVFKKVGSKKRARELLQRANLPPEQAAALERLMVHSS